MAQIVSGARHFVEYVTCLAVLRETSVLEGTAVTTHNSIKTLRKVVSMGRVVSGTRDHINRALGRQIKYTNYDPDIFLDILPR